MQVKLVWILHEWDWLSKIFPSGHTEHDPVSKKKISLPWQAIHFPFDVNGVSLGHFITSFANKNWNWFI